MKFRPVLFALFPLALCLGLCAQAQQQAPPEMAQLRAASQIRDPFDRIKELKRIRAAYPESSYIAIIDGMLMETASNGSDTLPKVLAAQKEIIAALKPVDRLAVVPSAATILLAHPKLESFPKDGVLKAIQAYKAEGLELLSHSDVLAKVPENNRAEWQARASNIFEIPLAKAQALNGNGEAALATMDALGKAQPQNDAYFDALGDIYSSLKRPKEALDAYTKAAVNDEKVADKARRLYARINGSGAVPKFDAELERRQAEPPFHPPAFVAPADWKGKTVLAELFTGSECPPCVSADLAFDGLLEGYPAKYLAILEYHLPIPGPDPMMNPATTKRGKYYEVNSTPSIFVDGGDKMTGGGGRAAALGAFNRYKKVIDAAMSGEPSVSINAAARLEGDRVTVDCEFSKVAENAEYNVVLVQLEEKHKGGNGLSQHKMVVRDIATVEPAAKATATFNIPESEKATDAHLTEFEKTWASRFPGFTWSARRNQIDRGGLKVVVFVQDKETKRVHNAFVAEIAKR